MNAQVIYREIIARYNKTIRFVIGNYFKNKMDQDDVYQETMIHIYEQLNKSTNEDLLRWESEGWIKVVVKNKCISLLRTIQTSLKHEKTMTDDSQLENEIHSSSLQEDTTFEFEKNIKVLKIRELLSVLNDRDRKLIILRYFKNYTIKQIDEMLNVNNSAVYLMRAVDRLKREIGTSNFYNFFDDVDLENDLD
jgi:RNA polymerase sigma-70 factor (ECF subfamily)